MRKSHSLASIEGGPPDQIRLWTTSKPVQSQGEDLQHSIEVWWFDLRKEFAVTGFKYMLPFVRSKGVLDSSGGGHLQFLLSLGLQAGANFIVMARDVQQA